MSVLESERLISQIVLEINLAHFFVVKGVQIEE